MPFARIDLARGKPSEYRATVADVVYEGIVEILKAPDGDRFMVIGEHTPENFVYDPKFLGIERSPDLIYIQVTSTVGNSKEQKHAFFRRMADELNRRLNVRREDVFISLVFVDRLVTHDCCTAFPARVSSGPDAMGHLSRPSPGEPHHGRPVPILLPE